ncbi:Sulfur oxidation SoxY protein [Salinisphaera shabanensis E1L3A]|uniref:Sulfur oxidation SoxY protein n=1 Tax=Salinisphaera shabanensis E1L3A TaxID=1033802 RepID=U2FZY1_9GAMM|nr:Sulfur oxidation SoxY protein [Salinisphaera shabanensis E1L3A]
MADRGRLLSRPAVCILLAGLYALSCASVASAAGVDTIVHDPLESSRWRYMVAQHFRDAPVVFDERVQVLVPDHAQDPQATPVQIRVQGLNDVTQIRVIADASAHSRVLDYFPANAAPSIGFSFEVAQATPLRAAVRTGDGVWHIGGAWVDGQGGGCAAPSVTPAASADLAFEGRIEARSWARANDRQRLKLRVVVPRQTSDIATRSTAVVEEITVRDTQGRLQARLVPGSPLARASLFTLDIPSREALRIEARDDWGNRYRTHVAMNAEDEAP